MATLEFLTALSVILLVGILLTYASRKLRVPNVVSLLLAGIFIGPLSFRGERLFGFSSEFMTSVAIIGLIMIVFDSSSRLPLRSVSKDTAAAFKITFVFIALEVIIFSVGARFIGELSWFHSILLSSILVGTDPSSVLSILKDLKHRVIPILNVEALVNTPLTVIIPFVVYEIGQSITTQTVISHFVQQVSPFLQQLVTGIGAGMVVSLVIFRIMRNHYSEVLSPVTFIASALLTYTLAESLHGNGVLAVTTLGLFFGNVYLKKKERLRTFGSLLSNLFEILVFLLLGMSITLPLNFDFYIRGFFMFVVYIAIRIVTIYIVFPTNKNFKPKEKMFMALNSSKGVAVGVVVFTLLSLESQLSVVVQFSLLFILYSIVLSTILTRFSKRLLGVSQVLKKDE